MLCCILIQEVNGLKWYKEEQSELVNWWQGPGLLGFTGTHWEWSLDHLVWSHRRATVAQFTERPPMVPLLTPGHHRKHLVSTRTGPRSNKKRCLVLINHVFFYISWFERGTGRRWHQDALVCGGSVMLWMVFCWETQGPGINVDVTLTQIKMKMVTDSNVLFEMH